MAQYDLVHQFKEQGFHDVTIASGTTNALYVGGFLCADSSTPSNFTIFAFHKEELNSDNCKHDYFICHLIQVEGHKKFLEEIKALLKQSVHVPFDFNQLGTQIQLFGAALTIFFDKDSVCTLNLNQLLTMIGRNKKSFQDQIALDEYFTAEFLFAIDKEVQRCLRSCKTAHSSRTQVNDRILQFEGLIDTVLNGTFHMNLPPSFAKVTGLAATLLASTENKQANGKNKDGSKDGKGQQKQKVMTEMETSSRTLRSPSSSNLPLGNRKKTTLQQSYHTIDLHGRTKFGCAQELKRRLLQRLHKSGQPHDKRQHPQQKTSRISHLPLQVPQGDSQEEIILTAWARD
jgi:hypothetical protein